MAAKDAAMDVLMRRAFRHGAWAHAADWLEQQNLAPEVSAEITASIERTH